MISLQEVSDFYKHVSELTNSISQIDATERKGLRKWLDEPQLSFTAQELSDLQPETWKAAEGQVRQLTQHLQQRLPVPVRSWKGQRSSQSRMRVPRRLSWRGFALPCLCQDWRRCRCRLSVLLAVPRETGSSAEMGMPM